MSATSIEWTHRPGTKPESWNPVKGCTKITPGCARCYASTFAERFRGVAGHVYERGFDPREALEHLGLPLRWRSPRTVFVNSMSDLWHKDFSDEYIAAVFGVMAATPMHTYIVLTKRHERMVSWFAWLAAQTHHRQAWIDRVADAEEMCGQPIGSRGAAQAVAERAAVLEMARQRVDERMPFYVNQPWPLPNLWLGVTVEDKARAVRIDALRQVPAAIKLVSFEPLLEDVADVANLAGIDWAIVGGESGNGARPFDLAWAGALLDKARAAGAAAFMKQLGSRPVRNLDATGNFRTHEGKCQLEMRGDLVKITSRKGNNIADFPPELRVREWPEAIA